MSKGSLKKKKKKKKKKKNATDKLQYTVSDIICCLQKIALHSVW